MVPLIGSVVEFRNQEEVVRRVAHTVFEETGVEVPVIVGTMIETPRAALTAGRIADGAGAFVPQYVSKGIFPHDPFQVLDTEGVGELIRMASKNGKMQRPDMHIGVCGEHGGDPESIQFLNTVPELDYVSCSAFRVPIARLAAAQASAR